MSKFLSQEWLDRQRELSDSFMSGNDSMNATVQFVVGETKYFWEIKDGKLIKSELGTNDQAQITLTLSYDDAVAIQQGSLNLSVAFMQGRLKIAGDMNVGLALLPMASSAGYNDWQEKLRAETEF